MRTTRILIVNNQAASRNLLRRMMSVYANLEIVGSVSTCEIALSKIPQVNPDIIMLDVDMPGTDVIQTLHEIRKTHPDLPVLMLCAQKDNKNAAKLLEALAAGANDFLPSLEKLNHDSRGEEKEHFRKELFQKLLPFCRSPLKKRSSKIPQKPVSRSNGSEKTRKPKAQTASSDNENNRIDIVAVGVSTGGPQALDKILPKLPKDFPVPIVIVQHMPSGFTEMLAKRLNAKSSIVVKEGQKGDLLQPGHACIAPGGVHMIIHPCESGFKVNTYMGPPENSCRPAVDVLFRSVADFFGSRTLAVILTGMGQDGLRGCEAIHESGGTVFIQDENSSVVWGMPGSLARAGLANKVLPLETMANAIRKRVWQGRLPTSSTHYIKNNQSLTTSKS